MKKALILSLALSGSIFISSCKSSSPAGPGATGPTVSGRISMEAIISGSRADSNGGVKETKTEDGSGTFVYDIPSVTLQDDGNGNRSANWNDAGFGGTANWVSEHVRTYGYVCDSYKDRMVTDKTTTTQTFSSAGAGAQVTGLGLSIKADGTYQVGIGPSVKPSASTVTKTESYGYCMNPAPQTTTSQSTVPFSQYFIPYVGGSGDKTTGKIDPAYPNNVKGAYHGTDQITMFSHNTTVITLPLEYTITWDLVITK